MQKLIHTFFSAISVSFSCMMLMALILVQPCQAQQNVCRDSLNIITQAYNDGEWTKAKNTAISYVGKVSIKKFNFFNDRTNRINSPDCIGYLPQAYYYLIKSYIRLYDLDSARFYYKEALLKELEINFDTADSNTKQYFSLRRRQFSLGVYTGSSLNTNEYHFNYKLGLQYGRHNNFKFEAYGEISFSQRYFNHTSTNRIGAFGRSLDYNPGKFPNYNFVIKGRERFVDLLYFAKFPISIPFLQKRSGTYQPYLSTGAFVSYYLNSSVNSYRIHKNISSTDTVLYQADRHMKSVDGLDMDLKKIYRNRFSFGIVYGCGVKFRLPNNWLMFTELRYTIGSNFKYRFKEFDSFKAGVSYLTFLVGFRKNYNYIQDNSLK